MSVVPPEFGRSTPALLPVTAAAAGFYCCSKPELRDDLPRAIESLAPTGFSLYPACVYSFPSQSLGYILSYFI